MKENKESTNNICTYCKYSQSQEADAYDACYNCVGNHTNFSPNNVLKQLMIQSGWQKSEQKLTHVILGFPGVGKTFLKEKFKGSNIKVLDATAVISTRAISLGTI